jgi:hypothetical protein
MAGLAGTQVGHTRRPCRAGGRPATKSQGARGGLLAAARARTRRGRRRARPARLGGPARPAPPPPPFPAAAPPPAAAAAARPSSPNLPAPPPRAANGSANSTNGSTCGLAQLRSYASKDLAAGLRRATVDLRGAQTRARAR